MVRAKRVHWPSVWRCTAAVLAIVYAAAMLGFFASRALALHWPPILAMLSYVSPFLFMPTALTLPLAFLSRSRVAQGFTLAVVALFLVLYLPFFLPSFGPPPAGRPLTVMAFNLASAQSTPEEVVTAIAEVDADIVALEELTPPAARLIREKLGDRYPYTLMQPETADTGLLSSHRILSHEWFAPASTGRKALQAAVDLDGTTLHIIVVHPQPPRIIWSESEQFPIGVEYEPLRREIEDISRRAEALASPVLVLGDFNMSNQSQIYDAMTRRLGDAFRDAGWGFGFTFPDGLVWRGNRLRPAIRIDYIFHSPDLRPRHAAVGCGTGSDHCYVTAEFVH